MPQGVLTEQQKADQKAKLKEFHEKGKKGEAPTSAGTTRPRKNRSLKTLSDRMAAMLPKALDIIENVIDGKEVDKQKVDVAKYVANHAVTLTKAQLQEEADILKYKVDLEKAKVANIIPREDPQQVARDLAAKGAHISVADQIRNAVQESNPEWDEDDTFSYEDDDE